MQYTNKVLDVMPFTNKILGFMQYTNIILLFCCINKLSINQVHNIIDKYKIPNETTN